jgi:Uma2 family endonuclease
MLLTERRADRVVLHNISWQQFENLLKDLGEKRSARVAYLDGTLEIMTPLPEHEYFRDAISDAVKDAAEILDLDYECYGSATWKREMEKAGLEPDSCFYFQNEARVRGKLKFDLNQDPPPDLALEIDLTSKSLPRFPIYARLGVSELWCYDAGQLTLYQLENGEYQQVSTSRIFSMLPVQELPDVIEKYRLQGRLTLRRGVRDWVRSCWD